MITNKEALSMAETLKYIKGEKDKEEEVKKFIKKFVKIKPEKAEELRKKINTLDLIKVKPEHIAKMIDLLPKNQEDLNKIFSDVSLDEDESKKILQTIEEFK